MSAFSKKEALTVGWNIATNNLWLFIKMGLLFIAVTIVPGMIQDVTQQMIESGHASPAIVLVYIASMIATNVLSFIIAIGEIKVVLRLLRGEKPRARDIFKVSMRQFFSNLFASFLYFLIGAAGFVLFIIPAIVWSYTFSNFIYAIADKNLGPIASLKFSSKITKGNKFDLFLLGILLGLVNIAGFFAMGIGLVVTIPITMVAAAFAYEKMVAAGETTVKTTSEAGIATQTA